MGKTNKLLKLVLVKYQSMSLPAKAGIWFVICSFLQKGISAITMPIYTHILSPEEYGEVTSYLAWLDITGIFITFGISSSATARGLVRYEQKKDEFLSSVLGLTTVTTIISFSCIMIINKWVTKWMNLSLAMIITIYVSCLATTTIDLWLQRQRTDYKYQKLVFLTLLMSILRPAICIALIHYFPKSKVEVRILGDTSIVLVVGIILYVVLMRSGKVFCTPEIWKELIIYALPLIPHYLSQRILSQSDRLMIQRYCGSEAAGIYSLAYSVGMLISMLNSALDSAMAPWIYRKIKEQKFDQVAQLSQKFLLLFGLCVIGATLFAPEMLKIFASKEYVDAIKIIPAISVSSFFIFLYVQFIYFEYYMGKTHYVMISTVISAALNILLNIYAIPKWGYTVAADTTLICYIVYAIGHYLVMEYLCKKEFQVNSIYNKVFLIALPLAVLVLGRSIIPLFYENIIIRGICILLWGIITAICAVRVLRKKIE